MLLKRISIGLVSFAFLLLISQIAAANTIVGFGDNVKYWTGYPSPGYPSNPADDKDTIGEPNITGGQAIFNDDGYLIEVDFNFSASPGWAFDIMKPGDLSSIRITMAFGIT